MAAFNRLTEATYEVHESVHVDTQDNEDHTFCGIMFPIKCKDLLPVQHLSIRSIAVRGQLGPMTVWVSKEEKDKPRSPRANHNTTTTTTNGQASTTTAVTATSVFRLTPSHWDKVYEAVHEPSQDVYQTFVLDTPILLKPGQIRAIYIHSTLPGDQAIVYDNASFYLPRRGLHPFAGGAPGGRAADARTPRYDDSMLSIFTGRAHVSNRPFGQMPIWGWGNAWRDHREFVGQLDYGAVYQLWNPETYSKFGPQFKDAYFNLKLCQTRWESPMARLPDECIYYILNMCRWDWFADDRLTMESQKEQQRRKEKEAREVQQQLLLLQQEAEQQTLKPPAIPVAAVAAPAVATVGESNITSNNQSACCCRDSADSDDDDDDEDYEDAVEDHGDDDDDDEDDAIQVDVDEVVMADEDDDDDDEEELDEDEEIEDEDDEEFVETSDDDEDDDDGSWERANGYRADHNVFRFVDPDREEELAASNDEHAAQEDGRQAWIRRQFERVHVLRALARNQDEDEEVVDMALVF